MTEDVSKEVLAGVEEPRSELIETAVKFLNNPKVQQSTLAQRKAFLERKGLTKDEIDLAVQRSDTSLEKYTPQSQSNGLSSNVVPSYPPSYKEPPSTLEKIRNVLQTAAMIGGLSYALYKFFTEIVQPWIYGKPKNSERLDRIEDMVVEINKSIAETLLKIQENLNSLQETVTSSQEKVQSISNELYSQRPSVALQSIGDSQFATEMKTELQTLKGLLLNRRQFPPTPSTSAASLPSWQLEQTSGKSLVKSSTSKENSGENEPIDNNKEVKLKTNPVTNVETSDEKFGESELTAKEEMSQTSLVKTSDEKFVDSELTDNDVKFEIGGKLTDNNKKVKVEMTTASSGQEEDDEKTINDMNDAKIIKNSESDSKNNISDSELD